MASILSSLKFDVTYFLAQVVLFIILILVMDRLFWRPILAHLRGRDKDITDAYNSVEATRHEMESLRADYQSRIAKIETEARGRIQAAIKEAQTERERILTEARAEAEEAIHRGIDEMEREKVEALEQLRERMVGMAMSAVNKALGQVGDAVSLRQSVEARIQEIAADRAHPAKN